MSGRGQNGGQRMEGALLPSADKPEMGRCNRENAKLSRLRKKRWVESLESRGKQLQNVVNLFITALRQPTDARTAITLSALVGAERLWPSYRAIVDSAHEVGTSERLVSFPRAIPPRDMEAMAQLCQDDLELLMALGASPASFLLVAKNQTVVFLSSTFCSMTGIPPEELTGRKFGALLGKTSGSDVQKAFEGAFHDGIDSRIAFMCRHANRGVAMLDAQTHGLRTLDYNYIMLLVVMSDVIVDNGVTEGSLCLTDSLPSRPHPGRPRGQLGQPAQVVDAKLGGTSGTYASSRPGLRPKRSKPSSGGRRREGGHVSDDPSEDDDDNEEPGVVPPQRPDAHVTPTRHAFPPAAKVTKIEVAAPKPPPSLSYQYSTGLGNVTPVCGPPSYSHALHQDSSVTAPASRGYFGPAYGPPTHLVPNHPSPSVGVYGSADFRVPVATLSSLDVHATFQPPPGYHGPSAMSMPYPPPPHALPAAQPSVHYPTVPAASLSLDGRPTFSFSLSGSAHPTPHAPVAPHYFGPVLHH